MPTWRGEPPVTRFATSGTMPIHRLSELPAGEPPVTRFSRSRTMPIHGSFAGDMGRLSVLPEQTLEHQHEAAANVTQMVLDAQPRLAAATEAEAVFAAAVAQAKELLLASAPDQAAAEEADAAPPTRLPHTLSSERIDEGSDRARQILAHLQRAHGAAANALEEKKAAAAAAEPVVAKGTGKGKGGAAVATAEADEVQLLRAAVAEASSLLAWLRRAKSVRREQLAALQTKLVVFNSTTALQSQSRASHCSFKKELAAVQGVLGMQAVQREHERAASYAQAARRASLVRQRHNRRKPKPRFWVPEITTTAAGDMVLTLPPESPPQAATSLRNTSGRSKSVRFGEAASSTANESPDRLPRLGTKTGFAVAATRSLPANSLPLHLPPAIRAETSPALQRGRETPSPNLFASRHGLV